MKVVWLSNVLFPEVCNELGIPPPVVGGWMHSGAMHLLRCAKEDIFLSVVSLYSGSEVKVIEKHPIRYYLIPAKNKQAYSKDIEAAFREINQELQPDIVHIHGTEYPHSLAWVKACGNKNVVVSIQGLVSECAAYYLAGISPQTVLRNTTLRDIIRRDSIFRQQKNMYRRGESETKLLGMVRHVIGRTSWDKSVVWRINPLIQYHFNNETLRAGFYNKQWQIDECEPYRIFLSQGQYPLKGLHMMVAALPIVLQHYPNAQMVVAGNNILATSTLLRNGYANYIARLTKKSGISKYIAFTGLLNEEEMRKEYCKAHVFVCPSAIENSANSIGEAQLLGVPTVASYVGGSMDLIDDGETGFLYRFEEVALLAMRICQIFENKALALGLSKKSKEAASKRHDPDVNAVTTLDIYQNIIKEYVSTI